MVGCLRKRFIFFHIETLNKCLLDEKMDGSIICIGLAEVQLFENGFHVYVFPYDFILNCIELSFENVYFLGFLWLYKSYEFYISIR